MARNLSGSLPGRPADSVTPFVLGRLQAEMAAQQAALRQRVLGRAAAQRGKGGAAARSSRWDYVEAGTGRKVKAGAQLGASVSLAASVLEQLRATLGHSSSSEVAGAPTPELVSSNAGAPQGRETRVSARMRPPHCQQLTRAFLLLPPGQSLRGTAARGRISCEIVPPR